MPSTGISKTSTASCLLLEIRHKSHFGCSQTICRPDETLHLWIGWAISSPKYSIVYRKITGIKASFGL
ncbi:hypothetical protein AGR7B_pAt0345 [Agrobacterium deltaense RV3]|nr:hypothetical protein AGR7B_pAt0345 [Agrobacterium deltaense RV3]